MEAANLEPRVARPAATAAHDPRAVAFIRGCFRVLGVVAPGLGAWLAEQLFVTPRRHEPPAHEVAIRAEATLSFSIPHDGMALDALSWGEGERVVVLAHGWEGRGTQLGRFVHPLVAAGFRVVAFDGPAHGRSPGRQTDIVHYSRVFASVSASVGPVYAVVAHSFGGAACMTAMGEGLIHLERLALVGVPSALMYPLGEFRRVTGLPDAVWTRLLRRMARRIGKRPEAADVAALSNDLRIPGLLVHCQDDTEVDYANAERIHAAWPHAELMTTSRLGHRRILKDPEVIAATVAFLIA